VTVETRALEVGAGGHVVHFYDDAAELCATVAGHLTRALESAGAGIAIVADARRRALEAALPAGADLVMRDAAETISRFMLDGRVDRSMFCNVIGPLLDAAAATGGPVHVYGEMVAILWDAGDVVGALEVEELWNELAREREFSLLCGYASSSVSGSGHEEALQQVCALHSCVSRRPPREISADFPARIDAPSQARRLVADALRRWGDDGMLLTDVQIVLGELAGNAVRHAGSAFSVVVRSTDSGVHVSVRDASRAEPTVREPTDTSGRGMRLVAALAGRWGVVVTPHGKTVWAELPR
jgi:anti-sigma regulatory factor (Ser/Thr protein kinase)